MLLEELEGRQEYPGSILDVGCGNGRNSIFLSSRFNAQVTVVDPDEYMLSWALRSFNISGRSDVEAFNADLEQISSEGSAMRTKRFDVVILSYVLQHVEPSFYPAVFDFLHDICQGYLALDVFWNPSRCGPGSTAKIGSTTWYGIRYEDLVQLIAPRFEIIRQRVQVDESSVIINLLARRGVTPTERIITREYNYYLGQLHVKCRGWSAKRDRRLELIKRLQSLPSFALLSSIFPGEMDVVKNELSDWVQSAEHVGTDLAAARYLWSCRSNKVPVLLREVVSDFGISAKKLLRTAEANNYIPPLRTSDYIYRACKQLRIDQETTEEAIILEGEGKIEGVSPAVRAGRAILATAAQRGMTLRTSEVAKCLSVSSTALRINLAQSPSLLGLHFKGRDTKAVSA
jgi:SAM-dependent methyltransferase